MSSTICSVPDCTRPSAKGGYCNRHYIRNRRHGSPTAGGTEIGLPLEWLHRHVAWMGDECLVWPFALNRGYAQVHLDGRSHKACRLMCELAHGSAPTHKPHALHSCGAGHLGCINPRHLRWGSVSENMMDRVGHGTSNRGAANGTNKLTEAQVRDIRQRAASGTIHRELAAEFGVARQTITSIVNGKQWGWLNA